VPGQRVLEYSDWVSATQTNATAKVLISFFLPILLLGITASAQQTIFSIPSSDVLDRGKVSVEFAAAFKANDEEALHKFSSFVPRLIVGLGKNVEIGFALIGNVQPGPDATTLAPGIKWKFYEKRDLSLYAGANFYIPVKHRAYDAGSTTYVGVSKSIGKARFTGGGFVSTRNVFAPHAIRGGGLFGFEYTVNEKIGFAADWINGRHAFGFFTSGLIYKPHPKVSTNFAYSIGNRNRVRGNHFFIVEMAYSF
jgi:hypothetical protein